MLTEVRKSLKLMLYYFRFNLSAVMEYRASFIMQSLGMMINNSAFIFFWWILFENVKSIGGYGFSDVMTIWAISSSAFGISFVFFGNLNRITTMIMNGELDTYLLQPKDPLINILCSKTIVSAWGDAVYGIVLFTMLKGPSISDMLLFLLFCITGALIFSSVIVTIHTISFYAGSAEGLSQLVGEFLISFSIYPEGIFSGRLKYILYSIIPVAFVTYIPARIFNGFSAVLLLQVMGAALLWIIITYLLFYRGLKKYESGNLIISKL
ncbi:MAG: ABC transporter permease [Bacillota bacterium]